MKSSKVLLERALSHRIKVNGWTYGWRRTPHINVKKKQLVCGLKARVNSNFNSDHGSFAFYTTCVASATIMLNKWTLGQARDKKSRQKMNARALPAMSTSSVILIKYFDKFLSRHSLSSIETRIQFFYDFLFAFSIKQADFYYTFISLTFEFKPQLKFTFWLLATLTVST